MTYYSNFKSKCKTISVIGAIVCVLCVFCMAFVVVLPKNNTVSVKADTITAPDSYTYTSSATLIQTYYGIAPNYNSSVVSIYAVISFYYSLNVCYLDTLNTNFFYYNNSSLTRLRVYSISGASIVDSKITLSNGRVTFLFFEPSGYGFIPVYFDFTQLPYTGATYQLNSVTRTPLQDSVQYSYQAVLSGSVDSTFLTVTFSRPSALWTYDNTPSVVYTELGRTLMSSDNYNAGLTAGYNLGYADGKALGYNDGYEDGVSSGKTDGYNLGYNAGVESANKYTFFGLIGAVLDAPISAFTGLFDFEILGINMTQFALSLLTVCVIITVAKFVVH